MYATHPAEIHHRPDWLGGVLALLLGVLLVVGLLLATDVLAPTVVSPSVPVRIPTTSEMLEHHAALEHHADIYGTPTQQLQRVFVLEHKADMTP